ncbi:phosphatase PAP2 family protein [Mesonia aestuariivivens]|uniref:Phosphatase PAP2 family protein n=1 Tax=Mesonia aestuariivivens TaxID=2796128 RepID=A0ABS6VZ97_9FLAO|nr:phosphatase PAP2 family protein [Mesonia aestuariivivens]MBW2960916.1 phosphatase PAP2 family protein [Mesonia aestuariivivens]
MFEQLKEWDRELFVYLNGLGIEGLDSFWIFVTQEETWIPLYIIMFILIFVVYKFKKALVVTAFFLISFLLTFGLTRIIKATVARARPNNVESLKEVIRILQEPTYYSFVSGHTSTSMAITTFIVLMLRHRFKWIYIFYIWPILFATSRVYVGVHYPLDLAAGALLGVIIAYFCYLVCLKVLAKNSFKDL